MRYNFRMCPIDWVKQPDSSPHHLEFNFVLLLVHTTPKRAKKILATTSGLDLKFYYYRSVHRKVRKHNFTEFQNFLHKSGWANLLALSSW